MHYIDVILGFTWDMLLSNSLTDLEANIATLRNSILDRNKLVDGSTMTDILN